MRKSIVLFAVENDCPAGGGFEPAPSVLAPEVSPFSTLGLDEGKDDAIDRLIMFEQVFGYGEKDRTPPKIQKSV